MSADRGSVDKGAAIPPGGSFDFENWRIIEDGTKLSVLRKVGDAYVEKGYFDESIHSDSIFVGTVELEDSNGCLGAPEFHAHGKNGVSGYLKVGHGTTPSAHKEADHSILWIDSNGDLQFEKPDGTDYEIIAADEYGVTTFPGKVIIDIDGPEVLLIRKSGDSGDVFIVDTIGGAVGIGGAPDSKAILTLSSTTKGFLPPRMTAAQRDAIVSPPAGLIVYDLTNNKRDFFDGTVWKALVSTDKGTFGIGSVPFATDSHHLNDDNNNLFWDNTNKRLGIGTNDPDDLLDVNGYIRAERFLMDRPGAAQSSYIQKGESGVGKGMSFYTVGNHRMEIEEGGNVVLYDASGNLSFIDGSIIETTRDTLFFNYSTPRIFDVNDGAFTINGTGNMIINTTSGTPASLYKYFGGAGGPGVAMFKARGTKDSPISVAAEDTLGSINIRAYDGSSFDNVGHLRFKVNAISAGDIASYAELSTADLTGAVNEIMRWTYDGQVIIGNVLKGDRDDVSQDAGTTAITTAESGKIFTNSGGTPTTYNLPPAVVGLTYTIYRLNSGTILIKPQPDDYILCKGVTPSQGEGIILTTQKDSITIVARGGTYWFVPSMIGQPTEETP